MKKQDSCKFCLLIFYFFTVNLTLLAQEEGFYKSIVNDPIRLDFSKIEENAYESVPKKDSFRVIPLNVNKNQIITPTYNYGLNVLFLEDLENIPYIDTVLEIPRLLFQPFTNLNPRQRNEGSAQLEFMHGDLQMVSRPDYTGRGSDFTRLPKSRRQKRKERALRYITTVVYPFDTTKIESK